MFPIVLSGDNLGGRQKQLNKMVNDTTSWDTSYETPIKEDEPDVDVIFKIDLASKFKNLKYLLDILRAGDSFYISRVLKQLWIYDNDYRDYINPAVLSTEIFPYMPEKMIRKFLTAISMRVHEEKRISDFCDYCIENKRTDMGLKFLIYTSEAYKLNFLKLRLNLMRNDRHFMKKFIGNSFKLCRACLEHMPWCKVEFYLYLYPLSPSEFLDIVEKFEIIHLKVYSPELFGSRITKHIIKKHMSRVLSKPQFYMQLLNTRTACRNISMTHAKTILSKLYPESADVFWKYKFYQENKLLFAVIPLEDRFNFIKCTFHYKYPGEPFENTKEFFYSNLYTLMTVEEKRNWATEHINLNQGFFGDPDNFTWYMFSTFKEIYKKFKDIISVTNDSDKIMNMLLVLLETTSTLRHLEVLLRYVYYKHIDEPKIDFFIDKVIEKYNVYELSSSCWTMINRLFMAREVYNPKIVYGCVIKRRLISLLYHITHDIQVPNFLLIFLFKDLDLYEIQAHFVRLKDKQEVVYAYLMRVICEKLTRFEMKEYTEHTKLSVRPLICMAYILLRLFKKQVEDYPEVVMKYIRLDVDIRNDYFPDEEHKHFSDNDLVRLMKQDITLVNQKIPFVADLLDGNLNLLLRKLKTYFNNDAANEWLNYFLGVLSNEQSSYRHIFRATYSIFILADSARKIRLMEEYSPRNETINHGEDNKCSLYVIEGICRYVAYSRTPLPVPIIMLYVRGDFVRYSFPMFGRLAANLPPSLCKNFVKALLEQPTLAQKQRLKLAFKCFNSQNIVDIALSECQGNENVSLKNSLFLSLYTQIGEEHNWKAQMKFIEILKAIMVTLKEEDGDSIFSCFIGDKIPEYAKGDYLEHAWNIIEQISNNNTVNVSRKCNVLVNIKYNIQLMRQDFIHNFAKNHINNTLSCTCTMDYSENTILENNLFNQCKWSLTIKYLVISTTEEIMQSKIPLLKTLMIRSFQIWNDTFNNTYVIRKLFKRFLGKFCEKSIESILYVTDTINSINMLECLLEEVLTLPVPQIYLYIWRLEFTIGIQNILDDYKYRYDGHIPIATKTVREMIIDIGRVIGNIIENLFAKKFFFPTFFCFVEDILNELMFPIKCYINRQSDSGGIDGFPIFLGIGLIKTETVESHMLALNLLPPECPQMFETDFKVVLTKLKSFNNIELNCAIYQKYCSDYKRRKYV